MAGIARYHLGPCKRTPFRERETCRCNSDAMCIGFYHNGADAEGGGHMADAGRLLADRYQLRERLAANGIADTWRASDLQFGRPAAVWLLQPEHAVHGDRLLGDSCRAMRVSLAGIVRIHDYGPAALAYMSRP